MKKLFNYDKPIITSLLETDTYKIRMLYFIWKFFRDVNGTQFEFTNRTTNVRLADMINIDEIREHFDTVKCMRFSESQIIALKKEKYPEKFLQFLREFKLSDIKIEKRNGQFRIKTAKDYWLKTTLWELITLPIISELYCRSVIKEAGLSEQTVIKSAEKRLLQKVKLLKGSGVRALQFSLRRRVSANLERRLTEIALNEMPDVLVAVSNMKLALKLGVPYGGTNAHELYSGVNAIRRREGLEKSRYAPYEVLEKWNTLFCGDNRVALPDTFGSKYFLENIPEQLAREIMAFRQDSGDPVQFGYWVLEMWRRFNIDAINRTILFSDGLNPQKMLKLYQEFYGLTQVLFGWGTNFGNDTGHIMPISIVMKLVLADWMDAVKLSDNLAKSIGEEETRRLEQQNFGYNVTLNEQCVY